MILRAEDFFARPRDTYARTLDFLGVAPFDPGAFSARNPTTYEPLDGRVRTWLEGRFEEPNARLAELLGGSMWWPADTPAASG